MSAYDMDFDRQSEGYDRCYTCGNRAYSGICSRCDLGESDMVDPDRVKKAWNKPWMLASRAKIEKIAAEAIAEYEAVKAARRGK